jgi:hypothetical protein
MTSEEERRKTDEGSISPTFTLYQRWEGCQKTDDLLVFKKKKKKKHFLLFCTHIVSLWIVCVPRSNKLYICHIYIYIYIYIYYILLFLLSKD